MDGNMAMIFHANFLLIVVLAILVGLAFMGYRKGFIKMVVSMLSVVITFVLVVALQPKISGMLREMDLYEELRRDTTTAIHDKIYEELEHSNLWEQVDDFENFMDELLERLKIPQEMQGFVKRGIEKINLKETTMENAADALAAQIGQKLADLVVDCGVFAISYIVILTVVKILFGVLNIISLLPLIHGANKLAGLALGFAEGLCIVWVFFLLATTFGGAKLNETLFPQIQSNPFLLLLYENNLLMKFLMK